MGSYFRGELETSELLHSNLKMYGDLKIYIDKPGFKSMRFETNDLGIKFLMCPHCYSLYQINVSYHSENRLDLSSHLIVPDTSIRYSGICSSCGNNANFDVLEKGLAVSIHELNFRGFITEQVVEEFEDVSFIQFKYFDDIIKYFDTLPITWNYDINMIKENKAIIFLEKHNFYEGIKDINEWVISLPFIEHQEYSSTINMLNFDHLHNLCKNAKIPLISRVKEDPIFITPSPMLHPLFRKNRKERNRNNEARKHKK